MEKSHKKDADERAIVNSTDLNRNTVSADDSTHPGQQFINLLADLQQFVQAVNQNDLLNYFHQGGDSTAFQRRALDLMINGEELGAETRHDHLTGLLDRTSFLKKLKIIISKSLKQDDVTAIIFVDLDDFKAINDQHGHIIGDQVISIIGGRISASIRAQDLACRWGGDEFVLALQAIKNKDLISQLANRLLTAISEPLQLSLNEPLRLLVGASVGVAIMSEVNLSAIDIVERADKAMYLAKKAGKNCVEFYS